MYAYLKKSLEFCACLHPYGYCSAFSMVYCIVYKVDKHLLDSGTVKRHFFYLVWQVVFKCQLQILLFLREFERRILYYLLNKLADLCLVFLKFECIAFDSADIQNVVCQLVDAPCVSQYDVYLGVFYSKFLFKALCAQHYRQHRSSKLVRCNIDKLVLEHVLLDKPVVCFLQVSQLHADLLVLLYNHAVESPVEHEYHDRKDKRDQPDQDNCCNIEQALAVYRVDKRL